MRAHKVQFEEKSFSIFSTNWITMRCLNYVFENRREKGKKKRIFRFDPLRIIHVIVYTFYRQYSKVIFDLLWIRQTKQIAWLLVKADSQECVNAFICIFHPIYIYISNYFNDRLKKNFKFNKFNQISEFLFRIEFLLNLFPLSNFSNKF